MSLKPIPEWPVLSTGSTGANVTALQLLLQYRGNTSLSADGVFGELTRNAVLSYQTINNLTSQNGVAGEETLYSLVNGLEIQSRTVNSAARAAQVLLSKFESVTIDGDFYTASAQATLVFQQTMGFPTNELTSVVGIWTWLYLLAYDYYTSYDEPEDNSNYDYANNEILTTVDYSRLEDNINFYKQAELIYGVPWRILAAIHYRENSFKRNGPSDGHGPYQLLNHTYTITSGNLSNTEFQGATNDAAYFLVHDKGIDQLDLTKSDNIKLSFFRYNMTDYRYINQAHSLQMNDYQANHGEGSPYVMNRADAQRDPTINSLWGQLVYTPGQGLQMHYPANLDHGAYLVYCSLLSVD